MGNSNFSLTFRQKVLLSTLATFLIFITLMVPFAIRSSTSVMRRAMADRAEELALALSKEPNSDAMVALLKMKKSLLFYRVSLISSDRRVLYDSHIKRLLEGAFSTDFRISHPEVIEALEKGQGYNEAFSALLEQDYAYFAKRFQGVDGYTYVLRIAFPLKYLQQITDDFLLQILGLSVFALLLFSAVIAAIFNHFSKPIQEIQALIAPYNQGLTHVLPEIVLPSQDEFQALAHTLNNLSNTVQRQINTLIKERQEKETILESLQEGVIAIDSTKTVTFANRKALSILECPSFAAIEKALFTEDRLELGTLLYEAQNEKIILSRQVEGDKNFAGKCYQLVAIPLKSQSGAVLVIADDTSKWRLIQMRRDFVANASHELKTPITIIQGFAETLYTHPNLAESDVKNLTEKIVRNCERMTHLIKQLLLLSDVEHIPIAQLEPCNVVDIMQQAKMSIIEIYPSANITLYPPDINFPLLQGHALLLERAFTNLLDNAVKYSLSPARVIVRFFASSEEMEISIQDFGMGISSQEKEAVFGRFFRSADARRKTPGSGLGLSIVQTIISKHQGTIDVDSEPGKGTTFHLHFPLFPRSL